MMTYNKIISLLAAFVFCTGLCAQNADKKVKKERTQNRTERLQQQATRLADELKLDDQTQAWFVPLYVEYQDTLQAVARAVRPVDANGKAKQKKELTDAESLVLLAKTFDKEERMLAIRRAYFEKFKDRLTPQQLVTVFTRLERPQMLHMDRRPRLQQGMIFRQNNGQMTGAPMGDGDF